MRCENAKQEHLVARKKADIQLSYKQPGTHANERELCSSPSCEATECIFVGKTDWCKLCANFKTQRICPFNLVSLFRT
jgi:hypothetical protein